MFLSASTESTYYNKGMYFMTMEECILGKPVAVEVMRMEAEAIGLRDIHIDAHCIEMDVKEYRKTINS